MLLPANDWNGVAEFVTERSAESATCTLTEALLLPELGSLVRWKLTRYRKLWCPRPLRYLPAPRK